MEIYLPIAGISENLFLILGLGAGVGLISGMFGVGGGFLLTPLLMQIGIPPPIAVASAANQVVGASVSGCMAHWARRNVDLKMGMILLLGGFAGSTMGVWVFRLLRTLGQIELTIQLCYVVLLGALGTLMLVDALKMFYRRGKGGAVATRGAHRHTWIHHLPYKMRFRRSKLYISALVPAGVGFLVGFLSAIMGVGGGFVMVPAMIYLIGMPSTVVVGTSLFQIIFVAANVTVLQAVTNQTVDALLALLLLIGGTVGAQIGARVGARLRTEQLRVLLALMVLAMSIEVFLELAVPPDDVYAITSETG
ncbi:sulfite exporter TauE/SafE family protein [Pelagibius marinus]|uniref:sulfite exporter TauE/SafE family protein n=1 Tax=Pelagibius marinus TaxID=2762760 RepID=UPI001872D0A6|nr:sulfite exporter TauE/SafE family protein [Pelagibius marinus]